MHRYFRTVQGDERSIQSQHRKPFNLSRSGSVLKRDIAREREREKERMREEKISCADVRYDIWKIKRIQYIFTTAMSYHIIMPICHYIPDAPWWNLYLPNWDQENWDKIWPWPQVRSSWPWCTTYPTWSWTADPALLSVMAQVYTSCHVYPG